MIELMNMHLSDLKALYKIAIDKNKKAETDENEKYRQQAEAMEDELEDML